MSFYLIDLIQDGFKKYAEEKPETKKIDDINWGIFTKTWMVPSVILRVLIYIEQLENEVDELKEKLAEKEK